MDNRTAQLQSLSKVASDLHTCYLCRETVPSTAANTSLSADNIVDIYAGTDGTLNATSASTAALAILACKVSPRLRIAKMY